LWRETIAKVTLQRLAVVGRDEAHGQGAAVAQPQMVGVVWMFGETKFAHGGLPPD
jgi:hypothetical protein